MFTTAKLADWIYKFTLGAVVVVGLPLIVFSGVETLVSELEAATGYYACMQAKTLDGKVVDMSLKVCKR